MLNWIRIKNLALVEEADIDFYPGFNVITGETGAGKSVIIGTMGLLLGERADKGMIRTGEDRCEISASITIAKDIESGIAEILNNAGITYCSEDKEIFLRRVITSGSTRNFINDCSTTLQTLRSIGEKLIDIHGANEHQSLVKQGCQLEFLDRFGGHAKELAECSSIRESLKAVRKRREKLHEELASPIEAEHLRMIVEEITAVAPEPEEDVHLSAKHAVAANSKQILEVAASAVTMLNDADGSVVDNLGGIHRSLQDLEKVDPENITAMIEQCDALIEGARELAYDLERYSNNVELDEEGFREIEDRLGTIQALKRRYGPYLENVFEALEDSRRRVEQFENSEKVRDLLDEEEACFIKELEVASKRLSVIRKKSAGKLSGKVKKELMDLGFLQSEFSINFEETECSASGCDKIDFFFSPNPGESAQPLRHIASSGEMSRVMLAVKTVLAAADSVPILVFDEVDANIGGETAIKVGNSLKKLSESHQVLCISHLPQVASKGDYHYLVEKSVKDERTVTYIKSLDKKNKTEEITRMLGGGAAAQKHAKELLK